MLATVKIQDEDKNSWHTKLTSIEVQILSELCIDNQNYTAYEAMHITAASSFLRNLHNSYFSFSNRGLTC